MSGISTHVLDTSLGRPAARVPVTLELATSEGHWKLLGKGATDSDGRIANLLPPGAPLAEGTYRLQFDTAAYFRARSEPAFYPGVSVVFIVRDASQHYHVPLLLSAFGYSTYRGN
jgi:5-hydroxyisourate hydrolase